MLANNPGGKVMKAGVRFGALGIGLLLAAAGCGGGGTWQEAPPPDWAAVGPGPGGNAGAAPVRQGEVSLYRDVQFQDIPVPPGYVLVPEESHTFQGSLFRTGTLVYEGGVDWLDALMFYEQAFPAAGWALSKDERGGFGRVFYFDKGQERLIAAVIQTAFGSRAELQLMNREKNDLLLKGKLTDLGYRSTTLLPPRQR